MIDDLRRDPLDGPSGLRKSATREAGSSMQLVEMEPPRGELRRRLRAPDQASRPARGVSIAVVCHPAARAVSATCAATAAEPRVVLGVIRLDPRGNGAWIRGEYKQTTGLRYLLLEALVRRGGRTLTLAELKAQVYGGERSASTCRNLVYELRRDIGCKKDLIEMVGGGWRLSARALCGAASGGQTAPARRQRRAVEKMG